MFPYLDLAGFRGRTTVPPADVDNFETKNPGWIVQNIRGWSSWINARLRKRYGAAAEGNSLPMGQRPPALEGSGTVPPGVTLSGRPVLGCMQLLVQVTTAGAVGAAIFQWSKDNGVNWTSNVLTGPAVSLPGTGLVATFGVGAYSVDNLYAAEAPVPEIVLLWLTTLVTWDFYNRRRRDPQDPEMVSLAADRQRVFGEVTEAADGDKGLLDLPVSEDLDTAVTTGGPLGSSETSPYVWTDQQACIGAQQDSVGRGT